MTELKSFLGIVNYYAKFIKNYASLAAPLFALLRKYVNYSWSAKCEKSFKEIKQALISHEVLTHFNAELPLKVTCDASPFGLGAILSHIGPNRVEKPIAFASQTLTAAERNYSQLEREALALIFTIKYFHQYVYGCKFILETDQVVNIYFWP